MKQSIVILTEDRYENPRGKSWYINNILKEDGLLLCSLKKLGFNVSRVSWSSKTFNWEEIDYAIFRTTWDYFERIDEFLFWIESYAKKITFINSLSLIRWNLDKNYLQDFPKSHVVPSIFCDLNTSICLKDVFKKTGWNEVIIKPSVSAAAWNTHHVTPKNLNKKEGVFSKLKSKHKMIIQEFQESVLKAGEVSMIVLGGVFSHAVLKKAKKNDYRVQDDFGGTVSVYSASKKEIKFAEDIVAMCPEKTLYARVDILFGNNKKPLLSELEIIEPELWFRFNEKSADLLAQKIFEFVS